MPRREKRGTGITKRDALVFDLRDPTDREAWNRRSDIPLVDWLNLIESGARAFLHRRGMSPDQPWPRLMEKFKLEENSLPIYAGRILEDIKLIRAAVERHDATEAADVGVRLGQIIKECLMKSRYEKVALHGEKLRERVRANASQRREKQKREADAWHRRARAEAKRIREGNPGWPTTRVAARVKERLKLSAAVRTVREVISRK